MQKTSYLPASKGRPPHLILTIRPYIETNSISRKSNKLQREKSHMQMLTDRRSKQSDTNRATRVPLTFHVSRFTPPIHQAVLHPDLSRRSEAKTDSSRRSAAKTDITLSNTDGFWELAFDAHRAVLIQDQALFYVVFLLAHPGQSFLPLDLAEKVYELYGSHPDFRQDLPGLDARLLRVREAVVLQQKVQDLEAILDRADEIEPVKAEALRELGAVYHLQDAAQHEVAQSTESAGHVILSSLYRLHLSIADGPALKTRHLDPGNPVRPFAKHLLRHLLIPTIRRSTQGMLSFVYEP